MVRQTRPPVAAVLLVLMSVPVMAGGLPRLCVPLEGVTADNAAACADRLAKALKAIEVAEVVVQQNEKQWYALFHFNAERVRLSDLEDALKDSRCSVSRDKLRLFGEVVLEVELGKASADKLLADLAAVKHVSISQSRQEGGLLQVTLALPYPPYFGRQAAEFGKKPFRTETFGRKLEGAPSSGEPVKAHDLPSYDALRSIVQNHQARLTGLAWNGLGCRVSGSVVAEPRP